MDAFLQHKIIFTIFTCLGNSGIFKEVNSSNMPCSPTATSVNASQNNAMSVCVPDTNCVIKKRRYDIRDMGWEKYYRGWADVQGQGGANDFCRMVGYEHIILLSCALAGTQGRNDRSYNSSEKIPVGVANTWYMKDEDGDGRDDYCRCLDHDGKYQVVCTKAGQHGFYGSPEEGGNQLTFVIGDIGNCLTRPVQKELGRSPTKFIPS